MNLLCRTVVIFVMILQACALGNEGEPPPEPAKVPAKPVELDETSKQTLDAWEAKAYHLGRAGVKKASFQIAARFKHPQIPKELSSTGTYRWDAEGADENAKLEWADPVSGAFLMKQGWSAERLSESFDPDYLRKSLAGKKLSGEVQDGRTTLTAAGEEGGVKSLGFDADGVLDEMAVRMPGQAGDALTVRFKLTYVKEGAQYAPTGWRYAFELPGRGKVASLVTIETERTGGFLVWKKLEEKVSLDEKELGGTTLEFSEYRFNDDVE